MTFSVLRCGGLQVVRRFHLGDLGLEFRAVGGRQLHSREEVADDAREERDVLGRELWQIHVGEGPEPDHVLGVLVAHGRLAHPSCHKQRVEPAHAEVIVPLRRELLGGELQREGRLQANALGVAVAERVEPDLRDEGIVRHHHGAGPEEGLEVVGELRAPRVAGVHGDVHGARGDEPDLRVLEDELVRAAPDRDGDLLDLLGHDREHLEGDAVELVEAAPAARGGEALEELRELQVVHAVAAVEDDALDGQSLGQVLRALRPAGAGRALRRAAVVEVEGSHQRSVAAIGERSDHESRRVDQVLEAIL